MKNAGYPVDLLEASKILPVSKDDQEHLCMKTLRDTQSLFFQQRLDRCALAKEKAKDIIDAGERAMYGVSYLISGFIDEIVQQKKLITEKEKMISTHANTISMMKSTQVINQQAITTSGKENKKLQESLKKSQTEVKNLEDEQQTSAEGISKADAQFNSMRTQRNIMGLVFVASALGFLAYFLRVKYASIYIAQ